MKEQFATPRRTVIEELEFETDIEELIQREDMVVTVSHAGYIKRVPLSTYRAQRRGGRGRAGMAMREEDFVSQVFVASTHAPVLFFTSSGRVYKLKVYRLPVGTPQARGKAMVNLLPNLAPGETISTVMPLPEDEAEWADRTVVFATAKGNVRRNALVRFRQRHRQRQDRDEVRGRGCRRPADRRRDLHRGGRHPAGDAQRPLHPLPGRRRARLHRPHLGRRARHPAAAKGDAVISMSILRHEDVPTEQRYAYLRLAGERAPRPTPRSEAENGRARARTARTAPRRTITEEQFADLAAREEFVLDHHREGLRQAQLGLRLSDHRPRRRRGARTSIRARPGRDRRGLPGGRGRPDHAGDRMPAW